MLSVNPTKQVKLVYDLPPIQKEGAVSACNTPPTRIDQDRLLVDIATGVVSEFHEN